MRLSIAIRAFFRSLFNAEIAQQIDSILAEGGPAVPELPAPAVPAAKPSVAKQPPKPSRSEALTLLATLQREARLVDFFKESLQGYSDAQIGAAARDIHRDTAAVLDRLFALEPVVEGEEGSANRGAGRIRRRLLSADGKRDGHAAFRRHRCASRLAREQMRAARMDRRQRRGRDRSPGRGRT